MCRPSASTHPTLSILRDGKLKTTHTKVHINKSWCPGLVQVDPWRRTQRSLQNYTLALKNYTDKVIFKNPHFTKICFEENKQVNSVSASLRWWSFGFILAFLFHKVKWSTWIKNNYFKKKSSLDYEVIKSQKKPWEAICPGYSCFRIISSILFAL